MLVTGVLGAAQLVNVANRSTAEAAARNGGTSVARRVIEAARGVSPPDLTAGNLMSALVASAPDLADSDAADPAWNVKYRGVSYTITAGVCTLDDPTDGIAASHDSSYCSNPSATSPADTQAADYKQVTVTVASRRIASIKQVTQVPVENSVAIPSVTSVAMTSPSACSTTCTITGTATSASFAVTTTENPALLTWTVRGTPMGTCPPATSTCTGSANAWSFTWGLGTPVKDASGLCLPGSYSYDGQYDLGAQAQDAGGLSAGPGGMTVILNRCSALPPSTMVATGRNATTTAIDVEWDPSSEADVVGYRVYKGASLTSRTPVCPAVVSDGQYLATTAALTCTDTSPLAYGSSTIAYYMVVALDRDSSGALREGAPSYLNVNSGNRAPNAVTSLTATRNGANVTVGFTLPSTQDPDTGDSIDSVRIYRKSGTVTGSPAIADRYTKVDAADICSGTTCAYVDTGTAGTTRTYWITAVDTHLRESAFTGPRSA